MSQYFQNVLGYSPLQAGLRELPLGVAGLLVIALIGPIVRRPGLGRAIALGLLVSAAGLTIVGFSAEYGAIAASAVSETAYELGAALGIAVLGTVLSAWARTGTFTTAMQGTSLVAAGLLALASFVAHRLIPSGTKVFTNA